MPLNGNICPMGRTKDKARKLAREYYMQGDLQKNIAKKVGVTQKTIGSWVKKYDWQKLRDAKHNSGRERAERIKEVIASLTDDHIELLGKIKTAKDDKDTE